MYNDYIHPTNNGYLFETHLMINLDERIQLGLGFLMTGRSKLPNKGFGYKQVKAREFPRLFYIIKVKDLLAAAIAFT